MKNIRYKLIVSAIVLLYAVILYFSPISCLFYEATGIKCPGCGMTRALLAAVRLDFRGAWECHRMFWSVPILYIAFLKDGKLFKLLWLNVLFYVAIGAGFLLNWQIA